MSSERSKPDFIKVREQAGGVEFENVRQIPWVENPLVSEYEATVTIRTADVKRMLKRYDVAWRNESGIFFQYPGFREGLLRNVRITDCIDVTASDELTGKPLPLIRLTVILQQDDYNDFIGKNSVSGIEE